ncbi:MAG: hypothetical protein V4773_03385 [Verrucomicrobiota bacterium]
MNAFCTTVTASHFPYARALARSFRDTDNLEPLYVLVLGSPKESLPADPNLIVVAWEEVAAGSPRLMPYYFSAFEFCNAAKPFLISHLFEKLGMEKVVYLDSDLLIADRFDRIWTALDTSAMLITPHHLTPPPLTARHTNEVDVIDLGFLNGGFTAWRRGEAAHKMLAWMRERFPVYGFYRHLGMAADQKLLPLLLAYFPQDVRVLFSPALNIAYWNAQERDVTLRDGRWWAGGERVLFFHLSGYKLSQPDLACAYVSPEANAALLASAPWLRAVMDAYHQLVAPYFADYQAPAYTLTTYDGVWLNNDFRRLLFRTGRLDRGSGAFWRIWLVQTLRMVKRLSTGVRPLR